jgi:glycosyltransferase involved in cell wall biosynthesis
MEKHALRVLHVITGLDTGGAEMMLLKLLSAARGDGIEPAVISLTGLGGMIGEHLAALGVEVETVGLTRSSASVARLPRLLSSARRFRPHLVHGWMYHGNLAASAIGALASHRIPILWSIRQTLYRLSDERRSTRAAIRLGAALSRLPSSILYNSALSAEQHEAIGYDRGKRAVIPNGFDCNQFRPSAKARLDVRAEFGLPADSRLIGLVARYHPMKGHEIFLRAARLLSRDRPELRFLLAGREATKDNPALAALIEELRLGERVILLGERSDMPRLTAALDIACSSSIRSEGFSNAIGEAMSCGIPCVATDIGESREIIGETGALVPAGDPMALAQAIGRVLAESDDERRARGAAARARVERKYSLPEIARRYHELYRAQVEIAGKTKSVDLPASP